MGELERLVMYAGRSIFKNYGWWGLIPLVLAWFILVYLVVGIKKLWVYLDRDSTWLFPGINGRGAVKMIAVGLFVIFLLCIWMIPSSPLQLAGLLIGIAILAIKYYRHIDLSTQMHYSIVLATALFLGLLIGGIFHDLSQPPAARCRDGSYSESSGRGTCSWHGGVVARNPDPWWESIFE